MTMNTNGAVPVQSRFSRAQVHGIAAALGAIAAVGLALSVSYPLLALTLNARGVPEGVIGLNTAFAGIASIAVTPFCARLAKWLGTPQAILVCLAGAGIALPCFYYATEIWMWFPLRLVFHAGITAVFVLSEFWINAFAPSCRRGVIMGIYATVLAVGYIIGPTALATLGAIGEFPFWFAAGLIWLAGLPVLIGWHSRPDLHEGTNGTLFSFLWVAPAATFAGLISGAVNSSMMSLLPVMGRELGFTLERATLLVTVVSLGNLVLQIPLGYLSDRIDRRVILMICASGGALISIAVIPFGTTYATLAALMFFWGGLTTGLYTIGLTHLGARFTGADLASANAAFVMMYSVGMITAPIMGGYALKYLGSPGLPLVWSTFLLVYAAVCLWRALTARKAPASAQ